MNGQFRHGTVALGIAREKRTTSAAVPMDRGVQRRLRRAASTYALEKRLVPPLDIAELRRHGEALALRTGAPATQAEFFSVLVSNRIWRQTVASVPYERRVLMLPECSCGRCRADARGEGFGVVIEHSGDCPLGALQREAETLGYIVLAAESTRVVSKLLEQGKIDAVVGVASLPTLAWALPHLAAEAVPTVVVPLASDSGDVAVDVAWAQEVIRLESAAQWRGRVDPEKLRAEVETWFDSDALAEFLGQPDAGAEAIGRSCLSISGKRWRPVLAACVYQALSGHAGDELPDSIRGLAIAVECFHKASLVHDDIEDNDDFRYGEMTLHRRYGVPIALNVGDFLLGEGYRLIAACDSEPERVVRMLAVAAEGHRTLSLGQGDELGWMRRPAPLSSRQVLEIFRRKTAPAFEVAVRVGAIAGGGGQEVCAVLTRFSESLGIAYQILDDLKDFYGDQGDSDVAAMRPSYLLAVAYENAADATRELIAAAWRRELANGEERVRRAIIESGAEAKAHQRAEHCKNEALRALSPLRNSDLKNLLHRVTRKILVGH